MLFYSLKTWVSQKVEIFFDLGRKPVSSAYIETFQERNKDLHLICRRQTVVTIAAACLLPWNILSLQSAKLHFFLWEISWQNHWRINNLQCWIMKEKDKPRKKRFLAEVCQSVKPSFPQHSQLCNAAAFSAGSTFKTWIFTEIRNMSP